MTAFLLVCFSTISNVEHGPAPGWLLVITQARFRNFIVIEILQPLSKTSGRQKAVEEIIADSSRALTSKQNFKKDKAKSGS